MPDDACIIATGLSVLPEKLDAFADWQARLNAVIVAFPGFVSLEIQAPLKDVSSRWIIAQRFSGPLEAGAWKRSNKRSELLESAKKLCTPVEGAIIELSWAECNIRGGVTEVIITDIKPEKESAYREWIANIHRIEAQFPGFQGAYVQCPNSNRGRHWITLLQFDSLENLERWLNSKERQEVLKQSESLIASLESHRVISPYAGWFNSQVLKGPVPPPWKQGMIVLLVLFPIVMLEIKFLNPHLKHLNQSLATFIANSISVALVTWPLIPLAIRALDWWLAPKANYWKQTLLGIVLVLMAYLIEIVLLWNLL